MVEAAKNEVRKYIKRERRKELPEAVVFWGFDCRFGDTEAGAKGIHPAEIADRINDIEKRELKSFYVEILAKPGIRSRKPGAEETLSTPVLPEIKKFGKD